MHSASMHVAVGTPATHVKCTRQTRSLPRQIYGGSGCRTVQRRVHVTRAVSDDSAAAKDVEKQLRGIVSTQSRKPRLKKRSTAAGRGGRKLKRPAPVEEEDDDAMGLEGLAGLEALGGGMGLPDDQLAKLLSGGQSEMTEEQMEQLLAGLETMSGGEEDEQVAARLEGELAQLGPKEMSKLLDDMMGAAGAGAGGDDKTLATLMGMLQGDSLDKMTDEQLEALYGDLMAANTPDDVQALLQQGPTPELESGAVESRPDGVEAEAATSQPAAAAEGGLPTSVAGGVAEMEAAEEVEGKAALEQLLQLIDDDDLANDPELKDMRQTFLQLKQLAGEMDAITGEELNKRVSEVAAQLQETTGEVVGLPEAGDDGQLDALWQDALASTLATLVASSYNHYFDRPLLAGLEEVEDGEDGVGGDAAAALYRTLEGAPACLMYLDYEEPERQVVEWANGAVGTALGASDEQLTYVTMSELLPGDEAAVQAWQEAVTGVWSSEPHTAVLPSLQLRVEGGVAVTARDVELFRVNSMGGEAIGVAMKFTQYQAEGSSPVVLVEA